MNYKKLLYTLSALLFLNSNTFADDTTLYFEGLKNTEQVQDFYNGGTGSEGSSEGFDYGITFSSNTLALIDSDAGGGGNFANEPSPDTIFFFTGSDTNIYMNVEDGFTEGFSFYYTSVEYEGDVEVWTEPNGEGKKIGTLHLDITPSLGKGDPNGRYDNWAQKSLSFDGRAKSIVFSGVANQIGFDNITLNPNAGQEILHGTSIAAFREVLDTDTLGRIPGASKANTFRTIFELKNKEVDLANLCNQFTFKINADEERGAVQTSCKIVDEGVFWDDYILTIDFRIPEKDNGYYFENGLLEICSNETNQCNKYKIWDNFNIYGTGFDMKKDSFSFDNGDWNQAIEINNTVTGYYYLNNIAKVGEEIVEYMPSSPGSLWASVGYKATNITNKQAFFGGVKLDESISEKKSQGLCYGMALVSAANYIHKNDGAWGTGTVAQWKEEISQNWDSTNGTAKGLKALDSNNIYKDYSANDIQSLKKIMYYHVAQPAMLSVGTNWVGQENDINITDDKITHNNYISQVKKYFLKDNPVPFSFDFDHIVTSGGHAILNTQIIEYNKNIKLYFYNNSKPGKFIRFGFKDGKIIYQGGYLGTSNYAYTSPLDDPLNVYSKRVKQAQKSAYEDKTLKYSYLNHIRVYSVGGTFKSLSLSSNNNAIPLYNTLAKIPNKKDME